VDLPGPQPNDAFGADFSNQFTISFENGLRYGGYVIKSV